MNRRDAETQRKVRAISRSVDFGLCPSICGKASLFRWSLEAILRLCRRFFAVEKTAAKPQTKSEGISEKHSLSANRAAKPQGKYVRCGAGKFKKQYLIPFLIALSFSCTSKPTNLRTLVPADTLVYLETNDLAGALQPIVDSKPFGEVVKKKPDFAALKGVQVAIAVTGFETTEQKLTDEHSVGRVMPHFVAVANTHAWNYQAVGFVEQKLVPFIESVYDSETTQEKSEKHDAQFFKWTAKDGRKAFALVKQGIIYFGNDESAIEKCYSAGRGEIDSIAKAGKIPQPAPESLAFGYVSKDGVAQIANIAGLKIAAEAGEDPEVQSAVAGILPQIIRGSVNEIQWQMKRSENGIEDNWQISMPPEIANVFSETMTSGNESAADLLAQIPADIETATVYNLKDPQIAWRSLLLTSQKLIDPLAGKAIGEFSSLLFEPYGIKDPEKFLNSAGPLLVTLRMANSESTPLVITRIRDVSKVKVSLETDFKPYKDSSMFPAIEQLHNIPDGHMVAFPGKFFITGDNEDVLKCLAEKPNGNFASTVYGKRLQETTASSITYDRDDTETPQLAEILANEGRGDTKAVSTSITETRFNKNGIDRKVVSDHGFIGWLISQLSEN